MIAQQVVFGYRDGHRPLGGSIELDQTASAALLGATDASVGSQTKRLITALPLPSVGLYALCGTWSAPERGRPGAVWAHAVLIPLERIGDLEIEAIAGALRRPSFNDLADYAAPVSLRHDALPLPADPSILAHLFAAATEPSGVPVVATPDLAVGETALFALWNAAWSELRARLSFRTRERVKAAPDVNYLCVARRVTGTWRPQVAARRSRALALAQSNWLREVAHWEPPGDKRGVHEFLRAFGPETPAQLDSLVVLGELHDVLRQGDPRRVARTLAADHPKTTEVPAMKRALFGRNYTEWWDAAERDVVRAIFGVGAKGFDVAALGLAPRVRRLVSAGHAVELVKARSARSSQGLRSVLRNALVEEATPSLLCDVMMADPALGQEIVIARPDLLERSETWSAASDEQAAALAMATDLSDRALAAAVMAGRFSVVEGVVSLQAAALRLARARQLRALRKLFDQSEAGAMFGGDPAAKEELRIQVAAAGMEAGPLRELLDALEARRNAVDEAWVRAAVYALVKSDKKQQQPTLEVVFGPLHRAVADGRFPQDVWDTLDPILPHARDRALRLRQLLVSRAREDRWSQESLERALRGSGPDVQKLKTEIKGSKDDPFVAAAKTAIKTFKRLT